MKIFNKFIYFIIFYSFLITALKAETLEDIAKELSAIKESISNLKTSDVKEALTLDKSFNEVSKAVDFAVDKATTGKIEEAVSALSFANQAMTDITSSVIPKEYVSEVQTKGEDFTEEQLNEVTEITTALTNKSAEKKGVLIQDVINANVAGLDTLNISNNLNQLGVKTINAEDILEAISKAQNQSGGQALRRSRDLADEIKDQEKFGAIIGTSAAEVELSLRQVEVIREGDPKKYRAFEIEKYGIAAGLSKEQINKGIQAVYDGNLNVEKEITKEIFLGMQKNPNWEVDGEINDLVLDGIMAESMAIQNSIAAINSTDVFGVVDLSPYATGVVVNDVTGWLNAQKEHSQKISAFADEVAGYLASTGSINAETIANVKWTINRQGASGLKQTTISSIVMSELQGGDYKDAYYAINRSFVDFEKRGVSTLAYEAANVEAIMSGDSYAHTRASYTEEYKIALSDTQKSELSNVYGSILDKIDEENSVIALEEVKKTTTKATEDAQKLSSLENNSNISSLKQEYEKKNEEVAIAQQEYEQALEDQKLGKLNLVEVMKIQQNRNMKINESFQTQMSLNAALSDLDKAKDAAFKSKSEMNKATENAAIVGVSVKDISDVASASAQRVSDAAAASTKVAAKVATSKAAKSAASSASAKVAETATAKAAEAATANAAKQVSEAAAAKAADQAAAKAASEAQQAAAKAAEQSASKAAQAAAQSAAKAAEQTAAKAAQAAATQAAQAAAAQAAQAAASKAAQAAASKAAQAAATQATQAAAAQAAQAAAKVASEQATQAAQAAAKQAAAQVAKSTYEASKAAQVAAAKAAKTAQQTSHMLKDDIQPGHSQAYKDLAKANQKIAQEAQAAAKESADKAQAAAELSTAAQEVVKGIKRASNEGYSEAQIAVREAASEALKEATAQATKEITIAQEAAQAAAQEAAQEAAQAAAQEAKAAAQEAKAAVAEVKVTSQEALKEWRGAQRALTEQWKTDGYVVTDSFKELEKKANEAAQKFDKAYKEERGW